MKIKCSIILYSILLVVSIKGATAEDSLTVAEDSLTVLDILNKPRKEIPGYVKGLSLDRAQALLTELEQSKYLAHQNGPLLMIKLKAQLKSSFQPTAQVATVAAVKDDYKDDYREFTILASMFNNERRVRDFDFKPINTMQDVLDLKKCMESETLKPFFAYFERNDPVALLYVMDRESTEEEYLQKKVQQYRDQILDYINENKISKWLKCFLRDRICVDTSSTELTQTEVDLIEKEYRLFCLKNNIKSFDFLRNAFHIAYCWKTRGQECKFEMDLFNKNRLVSKLIKFENRLAEIQEPSKEDAELAQALAMSMTTEANTLAAVDKEVAAVGDELSRTIPFYDLFMDRRNNSDSNYGFDLFPILTKKDLFSLQRRSNMQSPEFTRFFQVADHLDDTTIKRLFNFGLDTREAYFRMKLKQYEDEMANHNMRDQVYEYLMPFIKWYIPENIKMDLTEAERNFIVLEFRHYCDEQKKQHNRIIDPRLLDNVFRAAIVWKKDGKDASDPYSLSDEHREKRKCDQKISFLSQWIQEEIDEKEKEKTLAQASSAGAAAAAVEDDAEELAAAIAMSIASESKPTLVADIDQKQLSIPKGCEDLTEMTIDQLKDVKRLQEVAENTQLARYKTACKMLRQKLKGSFDVSDMPDTSGDEALARVLAAEEGEVGRGTASFSSRAKYNLPSIGQYLDSARVAYSKDVNPCQRDLFYLEELKPYVIGERQDPYLLDTIQMLMEAKQKQKDYEHAFYSSFDPRGPGLNSDAQYKILCENVKNLSDQAQKRLSTLGLHNDKTVVEFLILAEKVNALPIRIPSVEFIECVRAKINDGSYDQFGSGHGSSEEYDRCIALLSECPLRKDDVLNTTFKTNLKLSLLKDAGQLIVNKKKATSSGPFNFGFGGPNTKAFFEKTDFPELSSCRELVANNIMGGFLENFDLYYNQTFGALFKRFIPQVGPSFKERQIAAIRDGLKNGE